MPNSLQAARWIIAIVAGGLAGANALAAQPDTGLQFQAGNPALLECLSPAAAERGAPEYPNRQLQLRKSASVRVELRFDASDAAPDVKVLDDRSNDDDDFLAFKRAVQAQVKRYRLPCLVAGEKAVLTQQFDFVSDTRKVATSPLTADNPILNGNCKVQAPQGRPSYPISFGRRKAGNVTLKVNFNQSDAEPELTVLYGADRGLSESVVNWAKAYRVHCATPLARPVSAFQQFRFRMPDQAEYAIKDLRLVEFLAGTDRAGWGAVDFDLNATGCPFAVKLTLLQPYAANLVAELETYDASRQPFLKWLAKLKYKLPANAEPFLIGESLNVAIPCTELKLS